MQNKHTTTIIDSGHAADARLWVKNYADYLYTYAITRINDEELARDLVQETFLAALERLDSFEGRSSERTWLTAILKNKIIDVYRKKANGLINVNRTDGYESVDFFEHEDGHWKAEHQPREFARSTDDDPVVSRELNAVLRQCMEKLPALWLAVFTMKHMDDLNTEIICTELKLTAANFWVIIHRAKLNLRACLQKKWI